MTKRSLGCAALVACLAHAAPSRAHVASMTRARIVVARGQAPEYRVLVPLADVAHVLGGPEELSAADVRAEGARLEAHVAASLRVTTEGAECALRPRGVDVLEDEQLFAEVRFAVACPRAPDRVTVAYEPGFEEDPQHVGMLDVEVDGRTTAHAELTRERRRVTLALGRGRGGYRPLVLGSALLALVTAVTIAAARARHGTRSAPRAPCFSRRERAEHA